MAEARAVHHFAVVAAPGQPGALSTPMAGSREMMNVQGYSTDIPFGQALAMQTESPIER